MVRNLNDSSIPQGWRYDYLDNLAKRGSGHTPNKDIPEYWNGGIKWISLADSSKLDNGFIYETDKEISEAGIKNSSAVLHPERTVVLSRDAGVGKSAVMFQPMAVSQHFIAWRCDNKNKLNSWFLYNWLQLMKPEFERQAVGSTIKTIGLPYFKKLKIAVPPIDEQTKIAQILSTWDKAIEKLEALIAAKQERKKALMQQLLTGKKRFAGFEGGWHLTRLSDLIEIHYGKSPAEVKDDSGVYPIIGTGGINGQAKKFLCDKSAIVIGRKGTIDNPLLITEPFWPIDTTFYCLPKRSTNLVWLLGQLQKNRLEKLNESTGLPSLSRDNLYSLRIQTPPFLEQQKIASVLSAADKEIETHQDQLSALKQQKKGLMQQLLTGKKRVKIDEPVQMIAAGA